VDLHLGKGKSVYVYDYEDELSFVEKRDVEIAEDSKHQGGKVIKACSDCDVLIAVQYGFKSKIKADNAEIKLVMDEGPIDEVLQRYIDHFNFMNN
jgi:predicted Fe-Mo cluster-binding NifX family protein